jgi:hypothetical protein
VKRTSFSSILKTGQFVLQRSANRIFSIKGDVAELYGCCRTCGGTVWVLWSRGRAVWLLLFTCGGVWVLLVTCQSGMAPAVHVARAVWVLLYMYQSGMDTPVHVAKSDWLLLFTWQGQYSRCGTRGKGSMGAPFHVAERHGCPCTLTVCSSLATQLSQLSVVWLLRLVA